MKNNKRLGTAFLCSAVMLALTLYASAVLGDTLHVPGGHPTIQAAINAAAAGDVVMVADGTYTGAGNHDIDFGGKAITVQSENGPDQCLIDCEGNGRGFHFHNEEGSNSVLSGFTITNGYGDGAAIHCQWSSPTITDCIFTKNTAGGTYEWGGAVYCGNSAPDIRNCSFNNNTAKWGGGINFGGKVLGGKIPTVTDCTFTNNTAGLRGGAISCMNDSAPTITGCTITGNEATGQYAGGIYCDRSSPTLIDCNITHNTGEILGGGMFCIESSPSMKNCIISNNKTTSDTRGTGGGIFCMQSSSLTMTSCILNNNVAKWTGGIRFDQSSGELTDCIIRRNWSFVGSGGILCDESTVNISGGEVSDNRTQGTGGGMRYNNSSGTIADCVIRGNMSCQDEGGGIASYNSPLVLRNCTISDNSCAGYGGGIVMWGEATPRFYSCTISNNREFVPRMLPSPCTPPTSLGIVFDDSIDDSVISEEAPVGGGGIYCQDASPIIINTILWGNSPGQIGVYNATPDVTYCDVQGGWGDLDFKGAGNISEDPLFVGEGDYHLTANSPCIDAGASLSANLSDIDGDSRPLGLRHDIGSDEWAGVQVAPGDDDDDFGCFIETAVDRKMGDGHK